MPAAKVKTESEFDANAEVSEVPEGWEWDTIAEGAPTKVIFDTVGDVFVGKFEGKQHVTNEPAANGDSRDFDQFLFKGRDGERYAIPTSYVLEESLTDDVEGKWVRVTYLKEVPTARGLNPMKDFKVDVRK